MSSEVFFRPLAAGTGNRQRGEAGRAVLQALLEYHQLSLELHLPLKLHFGEKGNCTYLKPEVYDPVIDLIESAGSSCCFSETSVLYGGERFSAVKHTALAHAHGFTRIPVEIADGENGEASVNVPVPGGKHFSSAAIAEKLALAPQVLVVSHFKGHILAGFGGALKQLSMGFASKGGKMAMHLTVKPRIKSRKCKKCRLCMTRCNEQAIEAGEKFTINQDKCVGCGACFSICPHKAISVFSFSGLRNMLFGNRYFREKLAEYAFASHVGKKNIYLTFAVDVAPGCDCEPRKMSSCIPDIGVFASLDPVALDAACFDAAVKAGKRFRGYEQLLYAGKLGVGSTNYRIIKI